MARPRKIPPIDSKLVTENDRLLVKLQAPTKELKRTYGSKVVVLAYRAAGEAAVLAIKAEIRALDLIETGQLLESCTVLHAGLAGAVVGWLGGRTGDRGRSNGQVANYLNQQFGFVDYSDYLEEANDAWQGVFLGA